MDLNSSTFIRKLELMSTIIFGLSGPMVDLNSSTFIHRLEFINNSQ